VLLPQESGLVGPFLQRTPESVEKCYAINVLGVFYTAQLDDLPSANRDEAQGWINRADCLGHRLPSKQSSIPRRLLLKQGRRYTLARELGEELADRNIRVNPVSPR
jgi:sorbose reductase